MFSQTALQLGMAVCLTKLWPAHAIGSAKCSLGSLLLGRANAAFLPLHFCLELGDDGGAQVLKRWIIKREKKNIRREGIWVSAFCSHSTDPWKAALQVFFT